MSDPQIGEKEKITILTLEYNSLRSHINARVTSMFQLGAVFIALATLLLKQASDTNSFLIMSLLIASAIIGLFILWHDMANAGRRVQQLETEINRRAKEKLLIWENELGGLTKGYWRKDSPSP